MGIVIAIVVSMIVGFFIGVFLMAYVSTIEEQMYMEDLTQLDDELSGMNESYDFKRIAGVISGLSDKAQATFMFVYIQSIAKKKKLLATMGRYVTNAQRPLDNKEVAFKRK